MPLIMKFTESSRWPAVSKELAPRPRLALVRLPVTGGTTVPGVRFGQIEKVAAVERNLLHRLLINHLADGDRLGVDNRSRALHIDHFACGRNRKLHIRGYSLVYPERHAWQLVRGKPGCLYAHAVITGLQ